MYVRSEFFQINMNRTVYLNRSGETPVERDRFMILEIVGRTKEQFSRSEVRMGLKSHFVSTFEHVIQASNGTVEGVSI
jgi:hypothetical protein